MKNNIKYFMIFMLATLALAAGCKEEENAEPANISLSSETVELTKVGLAADNDVAVLTVTANTYWRAFVPESCDWLTMSTKGGAAGDTKIELSAASNLEGEPRSVAITLETLDNTTKTFTVSQGGNSSSIDIIADSYGKDLTEDTDVFYYETGFTGFSVATFFYDRSEAYASPSNPSSGYDNASAGNNLLIKAGGWIIMGKMNTSMSKQFAVKMGMWSASAFDPASVRMFSSTDGSSWSALPYSSSVPAGSWGTASTVLNGTEKVQYQWLKICNNSSSDIRIDDLRVYDTSIAESDYTIINATLPSDTPEWLESSSVAVFTGGLAVPFEHKSGNKFGSVYELSASQAVPAVSPVAGGMAIDGKLVTTTLPASQEYVAQGNFNPYVIYAASSADKNFAMQPMTAILRLAVSGETTIGTIVVKAKSAINGNVAIDFSATPQVKSVEGGMETTLTSNSGIALDSKTPVYVDVVVPAGEYSDVTINTTDVKGNDQEFTDVAFSVEKGSVATYSMYCESGNSIDMNLPSFYGESGMAKVYSNCYRISEPGEYKFACATPDGSPVVAKDVQWVWATSGMWTSAAEGVLETLITDIKLAGKAIKFKVPENFTPGNVILAAVDEAGVVQYSWHIWTCVDPKDETLNGHTWMDRNIGAAYKFVSTDSDRQHCIASRGFYFHWGDKTPIPWAYAPVNKIAAFTQGTSCTYYIYNSNVANTGEWSVMTTFPEDWSPSAECRTRYPMNTIGVLANAVNTAEIADWPDLDSPCPHGYHVMTMAEAQSLGTLVKTQDAETENLNVASEFGSETVKLTWPSNGYRNDKTGVIALAGNPDGRYWSNSSNTAVKGNYWLVNASNNKAASAGKNIGASVRCVKN